MGLGWPAVPKSEILSKDCWQGTLKYEWLHLRHCSILGSGCICNNNNKSITALRKWMGITIHGSPAGYKLCTSMWRASLQGWINVLSMVNVWSHHPVWVRIGLYFEGEGLASSCQCSYVHSRLHYAMVDGSAHHCVKILRLWLISWFGRMAKHEGSVMRGIKHDTVLALERDDWGTCFRCSLLHSLFLFILHFSLFISFWWCILDCSGIRRGPLEVCLEGH